MFAKLIKFFRADPKPVVKKIAFIDGDQSIPQLLSAYRTYIANTDTETHFIRATTVGHAEPAVLRNENDFNKIYLSGYTGKKEVVDKFIGQFIQQSVMDGYTHITVVSSDYDFIDIFKMAVMINPHASEVTFRMIVPFAQGRMAEVPAQISNIEIVKVQVKK